MITDTQARKIASEWYGGQWTGLYALASSGAIIVNEEFNTVPATHRNERGERVLTSDPDTLARLTALEEVKECMRSVMGKGGPDFTTLNDLKCYIFYTGPRGPVPGWSKLTW